LKLFSTLLLLLLGLFSILQSRAQLVNDSLAFESLKGKLSLLVDRFTNLVTYEQVLKGRQERGLNSGCGTSKSLTIQSDSCMTAKSVGAGKVIAVFEVDSILAVFVSHGDYFFTYSNMHIAFVKKGEVITLGHSIGQVLIPSHNGFYEMELLMTNKKAESVDPYPWFIRSKYLLP
jgi:hypothetical protein